MSSYAVMTVFEGVDKMSKVFDKMSKRSTIFGDKTDRAFRKASRSGSRFRDIVKGVVVGNAISRGFGLLARGIGSSTREFIDFEHAVISASAKFKDLNHLTAQGQKTIEKLKTTARGVGESTQFTATQAGQGLDFLAMAGFNAQQAMTALPKVVDLATVGQVDLARATDISTDSISAFGLMVDDANQLQTNFTRMNDVMALTMARSNTNIEDMFESVKKGAPVFTASGQSLETFNALIGIMGNNAVKGSEAGSQIKNFMLRLADPTKEAQTQLEKLNVTTGDSHGNFRDIVDIIEDVEKGLKGYGTQQRAAALSTIFGLRAVTGFNIIIGEGSKKIRAFRKDLIESEGSAGRMAGFIRTSGANLLETLKSASIEKMFQFFDGFMVRGKKGIGNFIETVRNFDMQPIIDGAEKLFKVVGWLYDGFVLLGPELPGILAGILALKIGFWGLNIAMAANPVGLIIVGVAALTAMLVNTIRNWDTVKENLIRGAENIGRFFGNLWDIIMFKALSAFNAILSAASKVWGFFGGNTLAIDLLISKNSFAMADRFNNFKARDKVIYEDRMKRFYPMFEGARPVDLMLRAHKVTAPNKATLEARNNLSLNQQININAPKGTTVESNNSGAPHINLVMAGVNP